MSRYPFSCACGSVFMTAALLSVHKSKGVCKPNAQYTLAITTRPARPKKEPCGICGGCGYLVYGKLKQGARSRGTVLGRPCKCQGTIYSQAWEGVK